MVIKSKKIKIIWHNLKKKITDYCFFGTEKGTEPKEKKANIKMSFRQWTKAPIFRS